MSKAHEYDTQVLAMLAAGASEPDQALDDLSGVADPIAFAEAALRVGAALLYLALPPAIRDRDPVDREAHVAVLHDVADLLAEPEATR